MPALLLKMMVMMNLRILKPATLVDGSRMIVDPFETVGRHIYLSGQLEPDTVKYFRSLIEPGMTFVDVGSNIGQYTVLAASPGARVFAFEPVPYIHDMLTTNIRIN